MPVFNPLDPQHVITENEHMYPTSDGEGVAGAPITVITESNDETNAASTDQDYWGEPMVVIPPATLTTVWDLIGLHIFGTTTAKALQFGIYRIKHSTSATRDAGNAWNQAATVLTLNSEAAAEKFVADDLVWIKSSAYKPDGEILKVASQTGATVTLVRETVFAGANNTGLRWNHTTNIGGGDLKIYLCDRDTDELHHIELSYSAATNKDYTRLILHEPRRFLANEGIVIRSINTSDGVSASFDVTAIYED